MRVCGRILRHQAAVFIVAVTSFPAGAAVITERSLASPNGSLVLLLERDDVTQSLFHSVTFSGRPVVTEFLCEDCNECGCVCPDHAITVPLAKVTF